MLPLLRHLTRSLLLLARSLLLLLCLLFAGLRLSFSLLSSFSSLLQKTGSPFNSLYGAVALSPSFQRLGCGRNIHGAWHSAPHRTLERSCLERHDESLPSCTGRVSFLSPLEGCKRP